MNLNSRLVNSVNAYLVAVGQVLEVSELDQMLIRGGLVNSVNEFRFQTVKVDISKKSIPCRENIVADTCDYLDRCSYSFLCLNILYHLVCIL